MPPRHIAVSQVQYDSAASPPRENLPKTDPSLRVDSGLVRSAKELVKHVAMARGLLVRKLPAGRQGDAFSDQRALLTSREVRTVIDAGAYVGETARHYRHIFPTAAIHCFEPVPDSFRKLSDSLGHDTLIHLNELALGDGPPSVDLHVNRSAATSSTLQADHAVAKYLSPALFEEVMRHRANATTIDRYCAERLIDTVDILKLDIQGGELAALRGASGMLSGAQISVIYTELIIAPMYEAQASVGDVLTYCSSHGYRLYGLYNFAYGADTYLYQMDAILVSPEFAAERPNQGAHSHK